jgi:hypothetical protein
MESGLKIGRPLISFNKFCSINLNFLKSCNCCLCGDFVTMLGRIQSVGCFFGSMGHAQFTRWKGRGLAHPTNYNATVEAIHWARMAAKEDTNTITILITNHNDWTPQQLQFNTKGDIHILITIPPHTIQYKPTPEWQNITNTKNHHWSQYYAYIAKQT